MVSDAGFIAVSFISLAGMVVLFMLNTSTWFKKENFKIQKKAVMDENRIKIKKLEREFGITGATKPYLETQTPLETGGNLLNVLKNLSGEQIQGLADQFLTPQDEVEAAPRSTIDSILDFATNNPEIAAGVLEGFTKKGDEKDSSNIFNK